MANTGEVLPAGFFDRPTLEVARELLNCRLCRQVGDRTLRWQITETEAYDGPHDKACHAHKGRTPRTEVMFGPAGSWYVYFCYGMHWMLNAVTGPADYPAAVLIRAAGGISGPARLTKAMGISGELNRKPIVPGSKLWVETGDRVAETDYITTPRIGVHYAGPDWGTRPYRFLVKGVR